MKFPRWSDFGRMGSVAPARERGLKSCGQCLGCRLDKGRSREGAWIEIDVRKVNTLAAGVAPARERGLKSKFEQKSKQIHLSLPRGSVD